MSIMSLTSSSTSSVRASSGNGTSSADDPGFASKLSTPRERFLSAVVDHALQVGRRSPKDFMRHFSAKKIMSALREQPRLRAKLLVSTTGINEKIAMKKPAASAGEDLELALVEGVTEEGDVVSLFDPDDRVSFLDHNELWSFVIEGEFWRATAENVSPTIAREHVAFILTRAKAERLLNDREIIDGITLPVLIESLPKEDLGRVIEKALTEGRAGRVFKDERVLDVLTPSLLAEHVSLAQIWERLIAKLGFGRSTGASLSPPASITPTDTPTARPDERKADLPSVSTPPGGASSPPVTAPAASSVPVAAPTPTPSSATPAHVASQAPAAPTSSSPTIGAAPTTSSSQSIPVTTTSSIPARTSTSPSASVPPGGSGIARSGNNLDLNLDGDDDDDPIVIPDIEMKRG